jgi:hypothetical protein
MMFVPFPVSETQVTAALLNVAVTLLRYLLGTSEST